MAESKSEGTFVVWAAIIADLAITVIKFGAAVASGSSAMMSEGVHSFVDTGNEVLLLYGMKRSARPPDEHHPLGYGRELYFWSFVVALLIFAAGAGVALYEGVTQVRSPHPIEAPRTVFAVLGVSALVQGASWWIAFREFRRKQGGATFWQAFRQSKDPTTFMILFEDSAAIAGIVVAAAGTGLALVTGDPVCDGIASLVIGAILAVVAVILARESKALLIGERAHPRLSAAITRLAHGVDGVGAVNGIATVQLAPDQVVVNLSLEFDDDLKTPAIEAAVIDLEARIRMNHPEVSALFVKPQSAHEAQRRQKTGESGVTVDATE